MHSLLWGMCYWWILYQWRWKISSRLNYRDLKTPASGPDSLVIPFIWAFTKPFHARQSLCWAAAFAQKSGRKACCGAGNGWLGLRLGAHQGVLCRLPSGPLSTMYVVETFASAHWSPLWRQLLDYKPLNWLSLLLLTKINVNVMFPMFSFPTYP